MNIFLDDNIVCLNWRYYFYIDENGSEKAINVSKGTF